MPSEMQSDKMQNQLNSSHQSEPANQSQSAKQPHPAGQKTSLWAKITGRLSALYLEIVTGFLWWGVGFIPLHSWRKFF